MPSHIGEICVLPGTDKAGEPERFDEIRLAPGSMYAVVGNTGSGKSQLIKDIEQMVDGGSATRRRVLVTAGRSGAPSAAGGSASLSPT